MRSMLGNTYAVA